MSNENTAIENALTNVEDVDNYIERFNELEVLLHSFLADAERRPPNIPNTDRLNRLNNIRTALNVYKNAYVNYAVELAAFRTKRLKILFNALLV
jgi:hypothetical protein